MHKSFLLVPAVCLWLRHKDSVLREKEEKCRSFLQGAGMNKFAFLKFFTKKLLFLEGLPAPYFIPAYLCYFLHRYGIAGFEQARAGCLRAGEADGCPTPG